MGPQVLKNPVIDKLLERAANCIGCGECMLRCPYFLPIPNMIKENLRWVEKVKKEHLLQP
jgi:predicted aldo/keto reductase-like oxidoreductase